MKSIARLLIVIAAAAGCGGSHTGPSEIGVSFQRIEFTGPASVEPGESVQYGVDEVFTDGSRRPVTAGVIWQSSAARVLSITADGRVTGEARGAATLSAQISPSRQASREVAVMPRGTYRVEGRITDSDDRTLALVGAVVEVMSGQAAGLRTNADGVGRYGLFGVIGPTEIRVRHPSYSPRVETLDVSANRQLDMVMTPANPRIDLTGRHTVTIAADDACATLPAVARTRSYSADLVQKGPRFAATLSGATFISEQGQLLNQMRGTVFGEDVVIDLAPIFDTYYLFIPTLGEQIDAATWFAVSGTGPMFINPNQIDGTLSGRLSVYAAGSLQRNPIASCSSIRHRITITR